jgi:hypothetical protein
MPSCDICCNLCTSNARRVMHMPRGECMYCPSRCNLYPPQSSESHQCYCGNGGKYATDASLGAATWASQKSRYKPHSRAGTVVLWLPSLLPLHAQYVLLRILPHRLMSVRHSIQAMHLTLEQMVDAIISNPEAISTSDKSFNGRVLQETIPDCTREDRGITHSLC